MFNISFFVDDVFLVGVCRWEGGTIESMFVFVRSRWVLGVWINCCVVVEVSELFLNSSSLTFSSHKPRLNINKINQSQSESQTFKMTNFSSTAIHVAVQFQLCVPHITHYRTTTSASPFINAADSTLFNRIYFLSSSISLITRTFQFAAAFFDVFFLSALDPENEMFFKLIEFLLFQPPELVSNHLIRNVNFLLSAFLVFLSFGSPSTTGNVFESTRKEFSSPIRGRNEKEIYGHWSDGITFAFVLFFGFSNGLHIIIRDLMVNRKNNIPFSALPHRLSVVEHLQMGEISHYD